MQQTVAHTTVRLSAACSNTQKANSQVSTEGGHDVLPIRPSCPAVEDLG